MLVETGFWVCLALLIYIYAGYPIAMFLLGRIRGRDVGPRATRVAMCCDAHLGAAQDGTASTCPGQRAAG